MHPAAFLLLLQTTLVQDPAPVRGEGVTLPTAVVAARSARPARATLREAVATATRTPPVLDGRDDDPVWREAQVIDAFRQFDPVEDGDPRFRTEARVLFDDRYLYVAVRAFDPHPDSILTLLSRRDVRTPSDQLKLMIDSNHDRRNGFEFAVNPAGVKRDFLILNDQSEDPAWDGVWDVATRVDSAGWVAEYRIPFSQLRFASRPSATFGFAVVRDVARYSERDAWPVYRRTKPGIASQLGTLSGLDGIPTPRRLEVMPYTVARSAPAPQGDGRIARGQYLTEGLDVKYGITSSLTMDLSVNPDFGQVEADPAVLNLSAFEQFFAERRPLFLEGANVFQFDLDCNDGACSGLFYSRRVGRSPQLRGLYGDASTASATRILGAAKLSGRLGNGLSVGFFDAVTQRVQGTAGQTAEPQTNYMVGRLLQDFNKGNSVAGLMVTATNRTLDSWSDPYLRRGAYSVGGDFKHRFWKNNYELAGYGALSRVDGTPAAIARTQRSAVHFFQRPDGGLALDTTRTSLSGSTAQLSLSKNGGGKTRFWTGVKQISSGFEINDLGFLPRADLRQQSNWFQLMYITPTRLYRRAFVNLNEWNLWNTQGRAIDVGANVNAHMELQSQWWLRAGFNWNSFAGVVDDRVARGGPAVRQVFNRSMWGGIDGDQRKAIRPGLSAWRSFRDASGSHGWGVDPRVGFRVASRFQGSLGAGYSHNVNDWQWVANHAVAGATKYTFAHLDQHTTSLTTRLDWTASPTLTLQVYAQPFVTTGDYSDWRALKAPTAVRYRDRWEPFTARGEPGDFAFAQFRSNTVLRWEYRPGSVLFLVWQQGRDFGGDNPEFGFRRGYGDLFSARPDNTLLVKASYWLNM